MPPGTGDAQLSLVQSVAVSGAVIVTTPQEMAVGDALKGASMFERVKRAGVGVVENMGPYHRSRQRHPLRVFRRRWRPEAGDEIGSPLLGSVPLQPRLAEQADAGTPNRDRRPASLRPGAAHHRGALP
jgi:ATP-binding protein involved in chromosome partitioning